MRKIIITALALSLYNAEAFTKDLSETSHQLEEDKNYYVKSKSYGTEPESNTPKYVRELKETKIKQFENVDWLNVGLQYRARFENRDNDFRRSYDTVDNVFLSRARAYVGVKKILDPLRFNFEFQDSRKSGSKFPADNNDVNKLEFLQSYGELYFKNALGKEHPISLRAGRMTFEVLDRRLIARNEWRNTTNNFEGFRTIFGQDKNSWQLDSFALKPVIREIERSDHKDPDQWFYGTILNWRRWSEIVTLQPFYMQLDQKQNATSVNKKIHSTGLRGYGVFGDSGFDYDLIGVYQFGNNGVQTHRAFGLVTEIGYNFVNNWKPRFSVNYGYGSGDKDPTDSKDQRFEKLFGFGRPWSSNDYLQWENIEALKTRIELNPSKNFRFDSGYSFYWLANSTDRWNKANLIDRKANSGDAIGQEFDARLRYKLTNNLDSTLGYAHFIPGEFTRNKSRSNSSDFIYLELTWSLFD